MLLGLSIISYLTIVLSSVSTFTLIILHIQITTGKKWKRCGDCSGCMATDCGLCKFCYDKPKFGGEGKKKQSCLKRKCINIVCDPERTTVVQNTDITGKQQHTYITHLRTVVY